MKYLLKNVLRPLYYILNSRNTREFYRLHSKLGKYQRFRRINQVKVLDYSIDIIDSMSFIFQFKEIFVDQVYKFDTSKSAPVIFDCGSNIGISILYFKNLFPKSKILSFEADPEISKILQANIINNKISDVEFIESAVWVDDLGVNFVKDGADGGKISFNKKNNVSSVRLKLFLDNYKTIDMLKIDIEGAEYQVLKDCQKSLGNIKNLFIEYHGFIDEAQHLSEILQILDNNNFRYYIENITKKKHPFIKNETNQNMDLQLNIFAKND